jgi:hypothetical protein
VANLATPQGLGLTLAFAAPWALAAFLFHTSARA